MKWTARTWYYKILENDGSWGPWTGLFKTEEAAKAWMDNNGWFWLKRGHILGLFHGEKPLQVWGRD